MRGARRLLRLDFGLICELTFPPFRLQEASLTLEAARDELLRQQHTFGRGSPDAEAMSVDAESTGSPCPQARRWKARAGTAWRALPGVLSIPVGYSRVALVLFRRMWTRRILTTRCTARRTSTTSTLTSEQQR